MIYHCLCVGFFFFFKQKTAYEMRISDWSSDVCSSDLDTATAAAHGGAVTVFGGTGFLGRRVAERLADLGFAVRVATRHPEQQQRQGLTSVAADVNDEIGRASCRERVCQSV